MLARTFRSGAATTEQEKRCGSRRAGRYRAPTQRVLGLRAENGRAVEKRRAQGVGVREKRAARGDCAALTELTSPATLVRSGNGD